MTALEHITLTTGAWRISPRSEVEDSVVSRIREALAADGTLWDTGWSVKLIPAPEGAHVFDLLYEGKRVVANWLCTDRRVSRDLWRLASRAAGPGVRLSEPMTTPWLAAAIAPKNVEWLFANPRIVGEAGDLERCVAWALLE